MDVKKVLVITAAVILLLLVSACQPEVAGPAIFTADPGANGQIALAWPDFVGVDDVLLRRSDLATGQTIEMGHFDAEGGEFFDGATQCGETYRYLLTAFDGDQVAEETCLIITLPLDCEDLTDLDITPCDDLPQGPESVCGDGVCTGLESPIKCPEDCGVMIAATPPGPTSVGATPVGPTLVGPTLVGPTLVGPTSVYPTSVGPTLVGPTSVYPTSIGPTAVGPTLVGPTLVPTVVPVCGNGTCEVGESFATCQSDCPTVCGDGVCEGLESSIRCPQDCGVMITPPPTQPPVCGDGVCNGTETILSCPADCHIIVTLVPLFPS